MVFVLATIELAEGVRDTFLEHMKDLVPQVRAEAGCLQYQPAVDVRAELPVEQQVCDDTVIMVEAWESVAALQAHLAAPHMEAFLGTVEPLVKKLSLRVVESAF